MQNIKEVDKLSPVDQYKDGTIPPRLKALKIVKDASGDQVDAGSDMLAPFSVASDVLGIGKFLKAMIKNPHDIYTEEHLTKIQMLFIKYLKKINDIYRETYVNLSKRVGIWDAQDIYE